MPLPSSACVPMTISILPEASPAFTAASCGAATSREACATFTGKPRKRSEKVLKCWRANSVVGTMTATCLPLMAARKAARSATSVLPKPTSPQIEPVHRPAGGQILVGRLDGGELVVGLLVGEAGAEFIVGARRGD